jgi:hypothetical protein
MPPIERVLQALRGSNVPGTTRLSGLLILLIGAGLHPWAVWRGLPTQQDQIPQWAILPIVALQILVATVGVQTFRGAFARAAGRGLALGMLSATLVGVAVLNWLWAAVPTDAALMRAHARRMVDSEDLVAQLTPRLADLHRSAYNLLVPGQSAAPLFDERVTVVDLAAGAPRSAHPEVPSILASSRDWPVEAGPRTLARAELSLWRPLLDEVDYFDFAKFYFVAGAVNDRRDGLDARMGFEGRARTRAGAWLAVKAAIATRWVRLPSKGDKADWRIRDFRTADLHTLEVAELPFVEVLDDAVPDPDTRARARRNRHAEIVLVWLLAVVKDPSKQLDLPYPHFTVVSQDRHPGVSVVDVDRDGFDDLYVMPEIGRNLLLRNRGDGTFEDVAPRLGLDLEDHTASAIFADFDNDGDLDAMLGRTLARSAYLMNDGGRFVDRSADRVASQLPYLVSAVTSADYDGDGLLDVYFSTYAEIMLHRDFSREVRRPDTDGKALAEFLSAPDAVEHDRLDREASTQYIDEYGPPNVLLRNVGGGRFAEVTDAGPLRIFRNTYQSTWSDYDGDGDPDLYCANDFAPNNLFRNDGRGRFTDVTAETGTQDNGFGMGVSWGDYDGDGKHDLYVSNMFSKAGRRITAFLPGIDPRFAEFARGNTLFRNRVGRFDRVSGLEPPAILVEKAGWSWGSEFVDVDNDGWLDIYALSGHYTAPKQVEKPVDT